MLTQASLSNLRLLMENSTFSWCLTQLLRVQLNLLISMLLKIAQKFQKKLSLTLLMHSVTTTTTGLIQSKPQLHVCWLIRLLFTEARLAISPQTLIFTSFHSTFEEQVLKSSSLNDPYFQCSIKMAISLINDGTLKK
jgi:hypothetical protein